jgi:hypothetical protein
MEKLTEKPLNPPYLVFATWLLIAPRLTLIINVAQRLTIGVTHDETVRRYFGSPRLVGSDVWTLIADFNHCLDFKMRWQTNVVKSFVSGNY